ncbi:reverse transcriptase domain-containing protein [Tanacetum coccineum]|uniref:Reverse transcriptase domain-containing protein n=1 Tax=Tanacetum coccineum TaxID=301880 RepID=A0ABQ5EHL8_9ASTR
MDRFCDYHQEKGHHTNDCHQLRKQLEVTLESGKLNHLIKDVRQRGRGNQRGDGPQQTKIINMIGFRYLKDKKRKARYLVRRIYVDGGASVEVMFEHCFENLSPAIKARLKETQTDLAGFAGEATKPLSKIELEVCFGSEGLCRKTTMKFTVTRAPSPYNVILGRTCLKALSAIPSLRDSDPIPHCGLVLRRVRSIAYFNVVFLLSPFCVTLGTCVSVIISECQRLEKKQVIEEENEAGTKAVNVTEEVMINLAFPDQLIIIGGGLPSTCKDQLKLLLKDNMDVFAWEPADMTGVPRRIIEHHLNVNTSVELEQQKHRVLAPEKSKAVIRDVEEWVKAGIARPNLNSACPKDFYPLSNIDCKVKSVMGFKYKCFLDAYKGYHHIQMSKVDEEKTTFYTDQGTYCYTKMPFGLKNAKATYQRLVDSTFQSQMGRNLEAYVDDMVIKSNNEKMLLADVAETFDNFRKINMKLNPKKCSFRVEEGKFLGYMVTSEGIRANPKKTRVLSNLQSPRTLKEMQSLAGKLAALNRFLAKSAEISLPFFNTLKNITKENKHEYKWTIEAEEAFQQMKRCIMNLPSLTPPYPKETLYAYLAVSTEAVSSVLLTNRKGKKTLFNTSAEL